MKVYNPITKMMEDKSKSIKAKDSKEDGRKSYYYKGYAIVNDNKKGTWKALKDGKFIAEAATDKELEEILSNIKTKDAIPDEKLRFWVKEVVLREFDSLGRKLNKIYDGSNKEVQFYIDSIQKFVNTFKNKL